MLRVDAQLNVLATRDHGLPLRALYALDNGLVLVWSSGSRLAVLDSELKILRDWSVSGLTNMVQKEDGSFVGYGHQGHFFDLHIDVSMPKSPQLVVNGEARQVTPQSGMGQFFMRFDAVDDVVTAVYDDGIFVFNLLRDANPDMGSEFRLQETTTPVTVTSLRTHALQPTDWLRADVEIVMVGTRPQLELSPIGFSAVWDSVGL